MNELNSGFWETRYAEGATGWDAGIITEPMKCFVDGLRNRDTSILIPGCGNAHEAAYLYSKGFESVHLLDYAAAPLHAFAKAYPGFPQAQMHCEDFFSHRGQYDLILEQTFFCALDPALRNAYVSQMNSLLKPGGLMAGVLFIDPTMQGGPPFTGNLEEYKNLFSACFTILTLEPCYNSIPPRRNREAFVILERKNDSL